MSVPKQLLVFRFSAMGDVAMTIPVLRLLLEQHPTVQITVVSNKNFQPLFANINRLKFYPADLKGKHKGIVGLYKLFKELKALGQFDALADLHNVLRTKIIRIFFCISSVKIAVINKGRKDKKALTAKENKQLLQLPTSFERYALVFKKLELNVQLASSSQPLNLLPNQDLLQLKLMNCKLIGIAAFAQHTEKMYPLAKTKLLVVELLKLPAVKIFLLGGGKLESAQLAQWEEEMPEVKSLAGKMKLDEELQHIAMMDVMITMDSANMHLGSLFGIPVISIWGATHPFAGFYGWQQNPSNAIQIDLPCRPCSIFGNKPCYRGDFACMERINTDLIVKKLKEILA